MDYSLRESLFAMETYRDKQTVCVRERERARERVSEGR